MTPRDAKTSPEKARKHAAIYGHSSSQQHRKEAERKGPATGPAADIMNKFMAERDKMNTAHKAESDAMQKRHSREIYAHESRGGGNVPPKVREGHARERTALMEKHAKAKASLEDKKREAMRKVA